MKRVNFLFLVCALGTQVALPASASVAPSDTLAYRERLISKTSEFVDHIAKEDPAQRKATLRKLQIYILAEKKSARSALEDAEKKNALKEEIRRLDERDSETIRLNLAFELVFEDLLDRKFTANKDFRVKSCTNLPKQIRFEELAGAPEEAKLSEYREQALRVVGTFCAGVKLD